jgi:hypothetical protein
MSWITKDQFLVKVQFFSVTISQQGSSSTQASYPVVPGTQVGQMTGLLMSNELGSKRKKTCRKAADTYPGICLEGPRKTIKQPAIKPSP